MTERIDYAAEAKANLATIADVIQGVGRVSLAETIAVAQVQATLALAEQQNVANMQFERAMLWQRSGRRVGEEAHQAHSEANALDTLIREGLGL